jgi:hypothetical protein
MVDVQGEKAMVCVAPGGAVLTTVPLASETPTMQGATMVEARTVRILDIHLGAREYGNELMREVAQGAFAADPALDVVHVHEHGGWFLEYVRDGFIIGTANDRATLSSHARDWFEAHRGLRREYLPEIRR